MELIRDVLDNQLVDRQGHKIGKVDGIVIELEAGTPPRLAYLEVGAPTLAHRLHPRLGACVSAIAQHWGINQGAPFRIPWRKVQRVGIDVTVDIALEETPAFAEEQWLRDQIIRRIPGAGR